MVLGIMESIDDIFTKLGDFVEKNYGNPIFWGVLVLVILALAVYVISELGGK